MTIYGLIGNSLSHSFSKNYFEDKFAKQQLDQFNYHNIEVQSLKEFFESSNIESLAGFNVTIPFKQTIIPFLDEINPDALEIGAVNCVKKEQNGWKGYNTDYIAFAESINPFLQNHHQQALVLGSGGASKAITYALEKKLNIKYKVISRKGKNNYSSINEETLSKFHIIIQCTPLGTHPNTHESPPIPYHVLSHQHLLFDLVYNPPQSLFLKNGMAQSCQTINGLEMLQLQAEKSWQIWRN